MRGKKWLWPVVIAGLCLLGAVVIYRNVSDGAQEAQTAYASRSNEDMDLPYVNEEGFAVLKAAYDKIDFSGEFQTGDPAVCDMYKEKFLKLLHNEVPFVDPETGEEMYLQDFDDLGYDPEKGYDAEAYEYRFFDINEDGAPELGIKGYWYNHGTYYFKYDAAADQWYFRLTEEQFDQLMGAYYEAYDRAEEGMASVKYTYEELFGH